MADSVSKTNIPVLRSPFGSETPPKVPVCETNDVGSKVNPVYVKDKVVKASDANVGDVQQPVYMKNGNLTAGDILAPVKAPHLFRDPEGGSMVDDVPTSSTPQSDDPDTMIATKGYVDAHAGGGGVPLLTPLWFDYILTNEPNWIAAEFTTDLTVENMRSGVSYQHAYNHLSAEYVGATSASETFTLNDDSVVTIQYKIATDGHKICDTSQISKLNQIFNDDTIGTAWFFVLDTTNRKFHLPRTKYGFHGIRSYVKRPQEGEESMRLYFYVGKSTRPESEGSFIGSDSSVLKTTEYNFPTPWSANQYSDYVVENDCTLFYHIKMALDGLIVNSKLFTISIVTLDGSEVPLDGVNPVTNGSDTCIGSVICKSGTVIRLRNATSGSLPASTTSAPLFYKLLEVGPMVESLTCSGRLSDALVVLNTVDYQFTSLWAANEHRDHVVQNDCILSYKIQIKCDGHICNNNRQFLMCIIVNGTEVPVDGVNEVSMGDDVRMGMVLCKAGTTIRMKNVSPYEIPSSTESFYILKELA